MDSCTIRAVIIERRKTALKGVPGRFRQMLHKLPGAQAALWLPLKSELYRLFVTHTASTAEQPTPTVILLEKQGGDFNR